jgi:hypothetical protein
MSFSFNQFGDLERCELRPGNVHSADGWQSVLTPVIERFAYNLGNFLRTLATPESIKDWSLTTRHEHGAARRERRCLLMRPPAPPLRNPRLGTAIARLIPLSRRRAAAQARS